MCFITVYIRCYPNYRVGRISTNLVLSQLGTLVGRGAVISFALVLFVLPALLMIFDKVIEKTTAKTEFYHENNHGKISV